jgi:thioredoxin 1
LIGEEELAIDLNRDDYEAKVLHSKVAVLVDFWGPLCKPCLALMPAVQRFERHYEGRLNVARVNATQNRMLCAKLRVMSLPTFILYKDGVENARLTGENVEPEDLESAIERVLT